MTKGGEETQPPTKIKITRHRGVSAHFTGTKLSRSAGNWNSWDQAIAIYFRTQTLLAYLRGTIKCPDAATDEEGYANWHHNNDIAAGEILSALDVDEHGYVDADNDTCAAIYVKMKARHANEGPIKQINLISDALSSRINKSDKDIVGKVQKICTNIRDAFQMGSITQDLLTSTALLYAISDDFPHLRTMIVRDLSEPRPANSDSTDPHEYLPAIRNLIEREATLKRDLDSRGSNSDSAMVAQGNRGGKTRPTVVCDNCRGHHHIKKYCIRPGGDMEGQTLEASKAKKQADYAARNGGGKQKVPVKGANGQIYFVDSSAMTPYQGPVPTASEFAGLASANIAELTITDATPTSIVDHGWIAVEEENWITDTVSINWDDNAFSLTDKLTPTADLFFADTGASVHISNKRDDFINLRAVTGRSVKGVGGSCVTATAIGDIRLGISAQDHLVLRDALFIPDSTVKLISISRMAQDLKVVSHFSDDGCWLTEKTSGRTIAHGALQANHHLYALTTYAIDDTAFIAQHQPTWESWHNRLGHASYETIYAMAKNQVFEDAIVSS